MKREARREPVHDFGPLALNAVRKSMIAPGWNRRQINQQTERLR